MPTDSIKRRYNELNKNGNSKWDALRETLVEPENEITSKKTREEKRNSCQDGKTTANNAKKRQRN